MRRTLAISAAAALAVPQAACAHGFGTVPDLPVPRWLFYYGGGAAVVVSFVALGALWHTPRLESQAAGRPLREVLQRLVLSPVLSVLLGAVGVGLLIVVFAAALLGSPSPIDNLAPTFVYVIFWLGLVPVVVLLGNVWAVLNPWRATADAYVWIASRAGGKVEPVTSYPEHLGRRPAAVLLLSFAILELAYTDPANPRALAVAILLYSYVTWAGMALFGRRAWLENGEAFNVYFDLLARMSPFATRERARGGKEIVVRTPLAGLSVGDARPGTLAFVAVMLGSVGFDGFSRTTLWQSWRSDLLAGLSPGPAGDLASVALNAVGLVALVALVALAYVAAASGARVAAHDGRSLVDDFLLSLVPIALAYSVAHYFSLLVLQGQLLIPLASDPLGHGWDLFGTADYRARLTLLSPSVTWYVQVGALVVGHVLALVLAHDRAVTIFRTARLALRAQYATLALMVLYTVGGLWLLSHG
ncbi:MAG: fenitrothion hydrolase [Actinomycetota bacterium]|nr:fenitrothion hydrolase [Actinomycetota bacterium]